MTKLLTIGILFSTAVIAVGVAKLEILVILFLTLSVLVLRTVVVAKLIILGSSPLASFILALVIPVILSSEFLILASYASFLTISFFTTSLSLLK